MQHEIKKITHITSELLTLLLLNGGEEIDIKVSYHKDGTEINLVQHNCNYEDGFIEKLQHNLNIQRQSEMEGYYWQLVGEDETGDELHLVGAMVDEAYVAKEVNDLRIKIKRCCNQ